MLSAMRTEISCRVEGIKARPGRFRAFTHVFDRGPAAQGAQRCAPAARDRRHAHGVHAVSSKALRRARKPLNGTKIGATSGRRARARSPAPIRALSETMLDAARREFARQTRHAILPSVPAWLRSQHFVPYPAVCPNMRFIVPALLGAAALASAQSTSGVPACVIAVRPRALCTV